MLGRSHNRLKLPTVGAYSLTSTFLVSDLWAENYHFYDILTKIETRSTKMDKICIIKKDLNFFLTEKKMYRKLVKPTIHPRVPNYLLVDDYLSENFDRLGIEWFYHHFGDEPTIDLPRSFIDFMRSEQPHLVPPIAIAPTRRYRMPRMYLPALKAAIAAIVTPKYRYQAKYELIERIGGLVGDDQVELPGWAWREHADELPPATPVSKYRVLVNVNDLPAVESFLEGKKGQNYETLRRAVER